MYENTWREFALDVLAGLEQVKQPVVIETDFAEYIDDDGMQVLHFKAVYKPVLFRNVTMFKSVPLEIAYSGPRTFLERLKYLITGKV